MGSILTNGVFLPAEGECNCYEGLAANWVAMDGLIGGYGAHAANLTIHVTAADKEAWNGKADSSALTAHTGDTTIHVTAADKEAWNGKADASALTAHTGNTTIHVTAEDKNKWDAVTSKADASALTAHTGDTTIHVTAEDKAKWDAVTGKADDADVVHKSGNETISGNKTFSSNVNVYNSDATATTPNLYLRSSKIEISSQGNTSGDQNLTYLDKNNTAYANVKGAIQSNGSAVKIRAIAKDSSDNSVINELQMLAYTNGNKAIFPSYSNEVDLGVSSYKWKSFNGVEPSSLSLPSDRSARIDISSYFTNTGTGQSNSYTVPANGYIYLTLSELTNIHCFSRTSGNVTSYAQTFTKPSNSTGVLYVLFPVRKNDVFVGTWYTTTTVSVDGAFFIPCQGNI